MQAKIPTLLMFGHFYLAYAILYRIGKPETSFNLFTFYGTLHIYGAHVCSTDLVFGSIF